MDVLSFSIVYIANKCIYAFVRLAVYGFILFKNKYFLFPIDEQIEIIKRKFLFLIIYEWMH